MNNDSQAERRTFTEGPPGTPLRVASFIASIRSGGIGPVCDYAARAIARQHGWHVTLASLIEAPHELDSHAATFRARGLNLRKDCARGFLRWLEENPQDVLITSGVSELEPAFPYLPNALHHIVQVHDSGRRYRDVATRYAPYLDGVVCVARHIEERLSKELAGTGFEGILGTVQNGADFPPIAPRPAPTASRPLQLLFMGRLDPIKGVSDFVPILRGLKKRGVPALLHIVGGVDEHLQRQIIRAGCGDMAIWHGRVPHEKCYEFAATSDVFLMLSRKEPFGMVVIEAMSMGCVPVAYDVASGPKEILVDRESGILVPLGDINAVVERLAVLHAEPALRQRMAEAAMIRARSVFSADRTAGELAEFIQRVASREPALRLDGEPPVTNLTLTSPPRGYGRLPKSWRMAVRRAVGTNARLCHWLLDR
jgi:glycosyltransferase involved in cell wall biosynthesis